MTTFTVKALNNSQKRIKCSITDHFAFRIPIPAVFFYLKTIDPNLIIKSLEHVLSDFPIFAGTLMKDKDQLYIDCNNQGVLVEIVHSKKTLSSQMANFPTISSSTFVNMIHPNRTLKNKTPVLTIKLTQYADGTAIGYCWHHSVGDMSTFMEFLKALSAFAKGVSYEKPVIPENREEYLEGLKQESVQNSSSDLIFLKLFDIFHFVQKIYSSKKLIFLYFTEEEVLSLKTTSFEKTKQKISSNQSICAHILSLLAICRKDKAHTHHASIIVNFRNRIGIPLNVLGNCVDTLNLSFNKPVTFTKVALTIHNGLKKYFFYPQKTREFVEKNGGIKKIDYIIPKAMLPKNKNLIITSWSKFGAYSIDFGVAAPTLFAPIGKPALPWISCIVEGFNNKGSIVALVLPTKVAKRFTRDSLLKKIHQYRNQLSNEEKSLLENNSWCL